jgi:predicted thioesterase
MAEFCKDFMYVGSGESMMGFRGNVAFEILSDQLPTGYSTLSVSAPTLHIASPPSS